VRRPKLAISKTRNPTSSPPREKRGILRGRNLIKRKGKREIIYAYSLYKKKAPQGSFPLLQKKN